MSLVKLFTWILELAITFAYLFPALLHMNKTGCSILYTVLKRISAIALQFHMHEIYVVIGLLRLMRGLGVAAIVSFMNHSIFWCTPAVLGSYSDFRRQYRFALGSSISGSYPANIRPRIGWMSLLM